MPRSKSPKIPFLYREQLTSADCFPTSMVNALGSLFRRHQIPPAVLQRVYLYSLDGVGRGNAQGAGTTDAAAELLAEWLTSYRTKHFAVEAEHVLGAAVHLGPGNRITECLRAGGRAVIDVTTSAGYTHAVLLINIAPRFVEIWDPLHRTPPRRFGRGKVEHLGNGGEGPNFRIDRKYFTGTRARPLSLGPIGNRACLMIWPARK